MAKLTFIGTTIQSQTIPNMAQSIQNLQSTISLCSFSIPGDFADGAVLRSLASELSSTKNTLTELNEWLKTSVQVYHSRIENFCSEVAALDKSELKLRQNIVK